MAYRFYPASHNKKVAPMPLTLNTKSLSAFPALGSGSSGSGSSGSGSSGSGSGSGSSGSLPAPASGEKKIQMPVKLDYKKTAIMAPPSAVQLEKMAASSSGQAKVTPSSMIPTRCYDEFGEDYDGPDEWEMEREAEEFQLNAALPVGGRRGGF